MKAIVYTEYGPPDVHLDQALLAGLCEAGQVKPVMDRRSPLSGVPDALRYLEVGRMAGWMPGPR